MNTVNTKTDLSSNTRGSYDDFKSAVHKHAYIQADAVHAIIASELTGARQSWIFDFRSLLLQPEWLNRYAEIFWELYADQLPFQVGGLETAGIPLVSAIVMKSVERGTPVNGFYIRKSRKKQGLMKDIEGNLTDEPVILVDDIINSGHSINKQLSVLERAGKPVHAVYALLSYRDEIAYAFLSEKHIHFRSLFSLEDFGIPLLSSHSPILPQDSFRVLWKYASPKPSLHIVTQKSSPAIDATRIYFGADDGVFRALELSTGTLIWEFKTRQQVNGKGILSSPALHGTNVYFGSYDGNVYALDSATGKKIWSYEEADWIGSSPEVAPDMGCVFIGLEFGLFQKRGGIAALDLHSGKEKWVVRHREYTHATPLYIPEESLVVVGGNDGILHALSATTGTSRWQFQTRGDIKMKPAYHLGTRSVLVGSMDGVIYAVSAQDGSPRFAKECGAGLYSTPFIDKDSVYIGSLDKRLYALDCLSGKDRWIFETRGRIFASPVVQGDSVWIGSNDGVLYEINSRTGRVRSTFQAPDRITGSVTFHNHHVYMATAANELYCLARK